MIFGAKVVELLAHTFALGKIRALRNTVGIGLRKDCFWVQGLWQLHSAGTPAWVYLRVCIAQEKTYAGWEIDRALVSAQPTLMSLVPEVT